jgi:hypothetical protein
VRKSVRHLKIKREGVGEEQRGRVCVRVGRKEKMFVEIGNLVL